jgi:MSHA biogenesis protein MshJ
MKQQWEKLALRIDALTLRERAMVFAAAAAAVIFLVYSMLLSPLYAKQKLLLGSISQQQNEISGIDAAITAKLQAYALDPDAPNRKRLETMKAEAEQTSDSLRAVQKGLVAPEKMIPVVGQLLRANENLRLLSLRNLPVTGVSGRALKSGQDGTAAPIVKAPVPAAGSASSAAGSVDVQSQPELLYRHGVEIVLQGGYLDMINYMSTLEASPTQLFWGKARLDATQYPNATLTLTLYTLSLDEQWMKL